MNEKQTQAVTAADHLIGNLLFNLAALPLIAGRLPVASMPDTPAAIVYGVMCELLRDSSKQLSSGALEAELKARKFDFEYIDKLQARIMSEDTASLVGYTDVISEAANLRQTDEVASLLAGRARKGEDSSEVLIADALRDLSALRQGKRSTISTMAELSDKLRDNVDAWQRGEIPDGLLTGFVDIDKMMRMAASDLILIAGRPSMGKSAFAFQIAHNVATKMNQDNTDGQIVIFSAEMDAHSIGVRFASAIAGVNSRRIQNSQANPMEYTKFHRAIDEMAQLPVTIDDASSPSTEQIYYRTAMLNAQKPVKLVIFDFAELASDTRRSASEEQRIAKVANDMKALAKDLSIPVILLSQLNREVEKRASRQPELADLRYSGNLEAVANKVIFLLRPEYYLKRNINSVMLLDEAHREGVAYAIVAKHRNGPVGTVALAFIEKYAKFGDLAR